MLTCPSCGHENADGARFCSSCGTRLGQASEPAREERKVVTVLFADLVGFTSRAEQLDPEDVRAVLEPYHARLRTELERRGGTVEKFIGDAVMALFGAPTAHEDDPERAVRAALAIRDWIVEEGDLQVRIAVTTGEALVALGARPSEGEGMASGDVVNTAARLQSAAPVNGILVDETTYRSTQQPILYEPREAVEAKGKSQPIPVWEALEARSRFGVDVARSSGAPLVGRESELGILRDTLQRARQEASPQLVTLVGVPGIGKSRLVSELFSALEDEPDLVYWRQGRCLPYGEGVTYWALSEMVKAHAGILETDSADQVQQRLGSVVAEVLEGASDRKWVEGHLRPLVGLAEAEHMRERSPGRGVRRLAEVPRSARRAQPARARLRGSPLGGRQPARLHRPPRRLGGRSADARRLHRSPRAPLAPARLGRRQAERGDDLALAALRRRHRAPRPRAPRAIGSSGRRSVHADRTRRGQPALRRGVRAHGRRAGRGRDRPPASRVGAGNHRRAPRCASDRREAPAPGRVRRRQGLLARPAGADRPPGPARSRAAPAPARAEGVRAPRAALVRRRGEPVRLQPPARR